MRPSKKQQEAIDCQDKYIGVIAPAGSGKTSVIVERLFRLIKYGLYDPQEILCITYTRLSAQEMKSRLRERLGFKYRNPMYMGTIHSCFLEELQRKENGEALNYTEMPIVIEDGQALGLFLKIRSDYPDKVPDGFNYQKGRREISKYRLENFLREKKDIGHEFAFLAKEYELLLKGRNLIDYEDILEGFFKLISSNNSIGNRLRIKWKAILIDECQDLDYITFEIIKRLSTGGAAIFMVGDPNQRIYGFTGAIPDIFNEFKSKFKGAKTITLEDNFRSGSRIVKMGNEARVSRDYPDSKANPENGEGEIIHTSIKEFFKKIHDLKPLAVLAATNKEFKELIPYFIEQKLPFRVSKYDFLNRNQENRECIDSLKSILFLNCESFRGIFKDHNDLLMTFRDGFLNNLNSISKGEVLGVPNDLLQFPKWKYVSFLISTKSNSNTPILETLRKIFNNGNAFFDYGRGSILEVFSSLISHICDLECQRSLKTALARLEEFIVLDKEKMKECPYYLGTVHSAKGLEGDNVGVLKYESIDKRQGNECLKYVAVTRAKNKLFLLN